MRHAPLRKHSLRYEWPDPPLQVALVEPEIPPNTGCVARHCAATGSPLHLVGKLGFDISDGAVRRAGLDYWDSVELHVHSDYATFMERVCPGGRLFCFSTGADRCYTDVEYRPGDILMFGGESRGLPESILEEHTGRVAGIPLRGGHVRSLNLAVAVGVVLYEALRQLQP